MRLLVPALLIASITWSATVQAETVEMIGAGVDQSCGSWVEARKQDGWRALAMQQWALGYLSGAAVHSENLNPLRGVDAAAVWLWFDNYCRGHPLQIFSNEAVDAYIDEHPR
jgi:hypothetical protein